MKRQVKSSLDFLRFNANQKTVFGQSVISGVTDNATLFPALPVTVATLKAVNEELINSNGTAQSRATAARSHLTNSEKSWNSVFKKVANYVSAVADGNAEIVEKAGFKSTKSETTPTVINPVPSDFSVVIEKGTKGSFKAGCKSEPKTKAYVFVATDPEMSVKQNGDILIISVGDKVAYIKVDTRRETTFTDVTSKKTLAVSMYSVNTAGSSPTATWHDVTPQ